MQAPLLLHQSVIRTLLSRSSRLPVTFAALVTSAVTICAQPVPVSYLPCDEGAGTVAHDTIGNHDAVLFGASGWETGIVGLLLLVFRALKPVFPLAATLRFLLVTSWTQLKAILWPPGLSSRI